MRLVLPEDIGRLSDWLVVCLPITHSSVAHAKSAITFPKFCPDASELYSTQNWMHSYVADHSSTRGLRKYQEQKAK
ncbi:hypothetical protein CC79DRAFT_1152022 [Sarocladium strictum]